MKNLALLIKLQKTLVDEQRILLAKLQNQLQEIENRIAEHEIMMVREQIAAKESAEASLTYGAFVKTCIDQGRELEKQRHISMSAVDIAREKLSELFEEQKRYEIAEEQRLKTEQKEERRLETIEMDEIGSVGFVRKDKDQF